MAHLLSLLALFSGHGHISHAEGLRAFAASNVPATRHAENARAFAASTTNTRHAEFARAFAAGTLTGSARHAQSLRVSGE